jgi:hypothetical protein
LFRAAAVPGLSSSRAFPSQGSRTSLEATCSLAVIHGHPGRAARSLSLPLSPTPTPKRSCLDPRDRYGFPFRMPSRLDTIPVSLDPGRRSRPLRPLHPLRSLDPPVSPFATTRVSPGRRPILSWIFSPLEPSPSTPRVLTPPDHENQVHASRRTTRRTSRPPEPGSISPTPKEECRVDLSTDSSPLRDWTAPPLDGAPTPLTFK